MGCPSVESPGHIEDIQDPSADREAWWFLMWATNPPCGNSANGHASVGILGILLPSSQHSSSSGNSSPTPSRLCWGDVIRGCELWTVRRVDVGMSGIVVPGIVTSSKARHNGSDSPQSISSGNVALWVPDQHRPLKMVRVADVHDSPPSVPSLYDRDPSTSFAGL
jgi:hypothetical protein